ncbi:phage tail protein [Escherichia coli]
MLHPRYRSLRQQVARETKVRRKLVKERARLKRATVKNPQARING